MSDTERLETGAPDAPASSSAPLAIVVKGYPRLSETFIAQELLGLQRRGLAFVIVSLRHPTDKDIHPVHREITAPRFYLPEYLYQEPLRVLRGWLRARRMPGYASARRAWLRDLWRDRTPNRVRRFGQACVLAAELGGTVRHLYAHFLHTPASVARYAALMTGVDWSVSAHAKDIWTTPDWEKTEKLAEAAWLVTCTRYGADHLGTLAPKDMTGRTYPPVTLLYHGLDMERLPKAPERKVGPDGGDPSDPVKILSVGRAVEKKGFDLMITALAALPADLHWRWTHIGGGQLKKALAQQADDAGISDRVDWLGARAQADVFEAYRGSDLFVLPSRIAGDGDRDGLPNVLMEAQSQGLACLATAVAGIPEVIDDGETGRLVPPDDAPALSEALANLIQAPEICARFGAEGAARVRRRFDHEAGVDLLFERLHPAAGGEERTPVRPAAE